MSRCYEIFQQAHTKDASRTVELCELSPIAEPPLGSRSFLRTATLTSRHGVFGLLDQLLCSEVIEPDEVEDLLRTAEHHENGAVREQAEFIRRFLNAREEGRQTSGSDGDCGGVRD